MPADSNHASVCSFFFPVFPKTKKIQKKTKTIGRGFSEVSEAIFGVRLSLGELLRELRWSVGANGLLSMCAASSGATAYSFWKVISAITNVQRLPTVLDLGWIALISFVSALCFLTSKSSEIWGSRIVGNAIKIMIAVLCGVAGAVFTLYDNKKRSRMPVPKPLLKRFQSMFLRQQSEEYIDVFHS